MQGSLVSVEDLGLPILSNYRIESSLHHLIKSITIHQVVLEPAMNRWAIANPWWELIMTSWLDFRINISEYRGTYIRPGIASFRETNSASHLKLVCNQNLWHSVFFFWYEVWESQPNRPWISIIFICHESWMNHMVGTVFYLIHLLPAGFYDKKEFINSIIIYFVDIHK